MKKDTLIMILLPVIMISLATRGIAQQPEFTKVYYDGAGSVQAYAIVKTSSNDLLVAGYCDNKPYAMMLDPQGNILWANSYGSDNGNIFSIAPTNDGDFILAGNMTPSGSTQDDILLIRITPGGDTVWSKTADLGFIDKAMFVMQTSDNGFLLTGYSRNSAVPHYKSFVMRLDSTVSLSWVKTFYTGSYYNYLYSAAENQDGSFLLAGSAGNGNLISGGALLMKLTSSGDVIWSKKQGVTFPNSSSGNDLKIFPDGIIWYLTDTNSQMALLKTDLSGNFLWCKSYDVTGAYSADLPSAKLHITPDGGFIFVNGSINLYYPMGTMVKVDSDGNGTWSKNIYLISADVVRSDDNGYVVAGNGQDAGSGLGEGAAAGNIAAEKYGLNILAENIEDNPENTTRFWVITAKPLKYEKADKTSVLVSVKDKAGALLNLLSPFQLYNINLSKIESRPSKRRPWDYLFFIDLEKGLQSPEVQKALEKVKEEAVFVKVLGTYPKNKI